MVNVEKIVVVFEKLNMKINFPYDVNDVESTIPARLFK